MKRLLTIAALAGLASLMGCGDKPQSLQTYKGDTPAYQGTTGPFAASGWKAGDKTSWEQGLKARLQNTQNEYNRLPPAAK
jgi:hypothetical protein